MRFIHYLILIFILCNHAKSQTKADSLIVFVGEKIDIQHIEDYSPVSIDTVINGSDTTMIKSMPLIWDLKFVAKYKVLQSLNGFFRGDTIEFIVFDHYGIPAFSNFTHALLFVSSYNGKYYHEKYQYFDVYLTKNGRWAGGYSKKDYSHTYSSNFTVKPEKIEFAEEVFYSLKRVNKKNRKHYFPSPYYKIKGRKAFPIYGNYIEELFELKKQGILKARGFY